MHSFFKDWSISIPKISFIAIWSRKMCCSMRVLSKSLILVFPRWLHLVEVCIFPRLYIDNCNCHFPSNRNSPYSPSFQNVEPTEPTIDLQTSSSSSNSILITPLSDSDSSSNYDSSLGSFSSSSESSSEFSSEVVSESSFSTSTMKLSSTGGFSSTGEDSSSSSSSVCDQLLTSGIGTGTYAR